MIQKDWMIQEGVRKKPRAMCPGLKIVVIVALGTESWIESCLGGLWSPTVVVGILRDIGVANQRPVHTLGIEHTRILACALEHHVESQSLPLGSEMELVIDARSGGMTDGYHIVLIYLFVAIHILILHITRNHGREGLSRRACSTVRRQSILLPLPHYYI